MKEFTLFCVLSFIFTYTAGQFGLWEDFKQRADVVHNYEYKALQLSKDLREARMENESLKSKVSKLISEKEHLAMNMVGKQTRSVASIPKKSINDLVNFELYQWSAEKLLGVGEQALHFKKYEKSAQFYNTLLDKYKSHKSISDKVLFEAGIAAYESKNHYDWSTKNFEKIVKNHKGSKYYRGAKLWLALSHFHQGDQDKFIETVNEFRKKYRNTKEWKVLSRYYEEINYRYKK
jgi:outer membrane protein assembly factor BamD (BamD/ComL family)